MFTVTGNEPNTSFVLQEPEEIIDKRIGCSGLIFWGMSSIGGAPKNARRG